MPVEFSVAAYRFGHSMARPSYLINDVSGAAIGAGRSAGSRSSSAVTSRRDGRTTHDLSGFGRSARRRARPLEVLPHGVDARTGRTGSFRSRATRSTPSSATPRATAGHVAAASSSFARHADREGGASSLAVRNLLRGRALGSPPAGRRTRDGHAARRRSSRRPMRREHELTRPRAPRRRSPTRGREGQLAALVLRPQGGRGRSRRRALGPVGGRIVAEVLIGLLVGDPLSYLSVDPPWKPTRAKLVPSPTSSPCRRPFHALLT